MPQQCAEPPPRPPPTGAKQGHNPPTTPPPQPDSPGKPPKPHPPNPTHPRGSSPHTRGARKQLNQTLYEVWIIPAYAGSTYDFDVWCWNSWDHPRIRGEHPYHIIEVPAEYGSSPHTRGAPSSRSPRRYRLRIIPAYAGSTESNVPGAIEMKDHPRIRGEHRPPYAAVFFSRGSSPHTRGAPSASKPWAPPPTDHPRIRGEHFERAGRRLALVGSSPHTRGALGSLVW